MGRNNSVVNGRAAHEAASLTRHTQKRSDADGYFFNCPSVVIDRMRSFDE